MDNAGRSEAGRQARHSVLTGRDIRRFHTDGYLSIKGLVPAQDVQRARAIAAALVEQRVGSERGDYLDLVGDDRAEAARVPQILMPARYAPELANSPLRAAAERIAQDLLAGPVMYEGEHIIAKPSPPGDEVPLHQDEAFWGENTEYDSISIWFPLQDTDERNGCLRFVPGSHRGEVVPHRSIGGDRSNNGLEIVAPEQARTVSAPLGCGDATVHHCRTIHGSGPNHSGDVRYAYIFGFGRPARVRAQPRQFAWLHGRTLARETRVLEAGHELTRMRPEL